MRVLPFYFMKVIQEQIFDIQFDKPIKFEVGEVLKSNRGNVKVTKVYRMTWFKRILKFFGFKVKENQIRVVHYEVKGK